MKAPDFVLAGSKPLQRHDLCPNELSTRQDPWRWGIGVARETKGSRMASWAPSSTGQVFMHAVFGA